MATVSFEIDEKGDLVGDAPSALKAILERESIMSYGNGVKSGQGKAAEEAKKQLEETLRLEKSKWEAQLPLEREKWSSVETENKALKSQLLDHARESQMTLRQREEAHAAELLARADALKVRDAKIRGLVNANVKALAAQAGAREESLSELEVILSASIGYDEQMDPYVKDADGNPKLQAGKRVSIESYVKEYLDTHPHHRKPVNARGGDARGGASLRGTGPVPSVDAAKAAFAETRSPDAINELFLATRKKTA